MGLVLVDPWGRDFALRRSVRDKQGEILFDNDNSGTRNFDRLPYGVSGKNAATLKAPGYVET